MSNYENVPVSMLRTGDFIFAGGQDREVLAVDYRPSYETPAASAAGPAYLVLLKNLGREVYRPGRTVMRFREAPLAEWERQLNDAAPPAFGWTRAEAGGSHCAYTETLNGQLRPDLTCPGTVQFTVRLCGDAHRKARLTCAEHLTHVIWQMAADHGGYAGDYLVAAAPVMIERPQHADPEGDM